MKKNVASQKVVVFAYDSITGAGKTGDSGNFTKTVSKDGASFSSGGGSFTEIANGYYTYAPTQAETNCDIFIMHVTSSTASVEVEDVVIYTDADLNAKIDTIDGIVDSILVDTGTTLDGKIDTIDGIVDNILVDTGTTLDGKIDTIDGIVDAILVDTGTTLDGKINTIDTVVDSILEDTGTTGVALTAAGLNGITIDGKTLPEALQLIAAVLCGQVSGAGTGTEVFKGLDASTTRVTVAVDSSGNRTSVTYG
tara:strand:- start:644 stop:1399 length:756 start_codon:yes stop_codon:yes gene_type:complete